MSSEAHPTSRLPGGAAHLDQIVRHQPVPAHDEIERRLRLADAALAQQEDADAEHVHQHGVDAGGRRQLQLEVLLDLIDRHRGDERRPQAAGTPSRSAVSRSSVIRLQPLGHHHAGGVEAEERLDRLPRRLVAQRLQVGDLGRAQDLHPLGVDLQDVPGQRQPRLLDAVDGDLPAEARLPRDQRQMQARPLVEQRPDRQRRRHGVHHTLTGGGRRKACPHRYPLARAGERDRTR